MLKKISVYGLLLIIVILFTLSVDNLYKSENIISDHTQLEVPKKSDEISNYPQLESPKKSDEFLDIDLHSSNAVLVNLDENTILLDKNSEEKIYPASLTKLMTVLVAIEKIPDLEEKILLPKKIFTGLNAANASMAGFLPNEEVKAKDLLYGSMLPSGAEASIGLANFIAGSEKRFVELMNEKAQQLGMKDTHFKNVTGLHNVDHYTSVKDISILLQYALTNNTFRDVFTAKRHSISPTNLHPEGITLWSTLFSKTSSDLPKGEIIGGKTGYTEKAGLCLASLALINGQEYILVTAGAKGDHYTEQYNITDAITVYSRL